MTATADDRALEDVPFVTGEDRATCCWSTASWLFGDSEPCSNRGTSIVLSGCEHEHMIRSLTCADCLPMVRRTMDTGYGLCTRCRDHGGQDGVPMRFIRAEAVPHGE